jgi:transposase
MASRSRGWEGRKRPRELGVVERQRAADELRRGAGVAVVAARFGVSERTVDRIRARDVVVRRRRSDSGFRLRFEERVEIEVRCEDGQSVRRIAGAMGRSASTVCRELARTGVGSAIGRGGRRRGRRRVRGVPSRGSWWARRGCGRRCGRG